MAILDKHTNKIVGEVVLNAYDASDYSMNFRILIGKEGRDQGFGTEATQLFCECVFDQTGFKAFSVGNNEWAIDVSGWIQSICD